MPVEIPVFNQSKIDLFIAVLLGIIHCQKMKNITQTMTPHGTNYWCWGKLQKIKYSNPYKNKYKIGQVIIVLQLSQTSNKYL